MWKFFVCVDLRCISGKNTPQFLFLYFLFNKTVLCYALLLQAGLDALTMETFIQMGGSPKPKKSTRLSDMMASSSGNSSPVKPASPGPKSGSGSESTQGIEKQTGIGTS